MKIVEMHPEDLLDKEAEGEITESERVLLDAHLARCSTCRFEREVRADFAGELGDDDAELSSQRLVALVEDPISLKKIEEKAIEVEAKASVDNDEEAVVENSDSDKLEEQTALEKADKQQHLFTLTPRQKRARRAARIVMLIAAALLVGSAATAGATSRVWARIAAVWSEPAETFETPAEPHATAHPASIGASAVVPQRTPPEVDVITPTDVTAPESNVLTNTPAALTAPIPAAPATASETAASLFDSANEARRQGDYARAITLSHRLQHQYPTSRETHTSHATVGRLLLDRGDAVGALASFDAYQSHGSGALDEAVMVGRATALDRLGRTDEARNAWRALLTTFPETPYAEHAHSRIGSVTSPMH